MTEQQSPDPADRRSTPAFPTGSSGPVVSMSTRHPLCSSRFPPIQIGHGAGCRFCPWERSSRKTRHLFYFCPASNSFRMPVTSSAAGLPTSAPLLANASRMLPAVRIDPLRGFVEAASWDRIADSLATNAAWLSVRCSVHSATATSSLRSKSSISFEGAANSADLDSILFRSSLFTESHSGACQRL